MAGEVRIGTSFGRAAAWTFPKLRCFLEYQALIVATVTLVVVWAQRSVRPPPAARADVGRDDAEETDAEETLVVPASLATGEMPLQAEE
jgi:hypothetical protein